MLARFDFGKSVGFDSETVNSPYAYDADVSQQRLESGNFRSSASFLRPCIYYLALSQDLRVSHPIRMPRSRLCPNRD